MFAVEGERTATALVQTTFDERNGDVSPSGGTRAVWSADGTELFYLVAPGRMMAVPVELGDTFRYGTAVELFSGPYIAANVLRTYDVSRDGQRFLMIKSAAGADEAPEAQIVIVQNWLEELKRLVATE